MNFIRQTNGFARASVAATVVALMALCMLPGLIPGASVAHAQNTNATISGQIFDPLGSLVPAAQVVIVNQETGVTAFNSKSDSAGAFVASQVIPGTYKITVSAPSLKTTVVDDLQANAKHSSAASRPLRSASPATPSCRVPRGRRFSARRPPGAR